MKQKVLLLTICLLAILSLQAQTNERYIEVTGTSEIEIVPDKIHYLIEIREYFEEEFDGKSKPEEYRTFIRDRTRTERSPCQRRHSTKCYSHARNR